MKEEEIKAVLLDMDTDVVCEAFALLLAESGAAPAVPQSPDFGNFAQAVMYLKKNYDFAELKFFETEADLVYVTSGGRRTLLTDLSVPNETPALLQRGRQSLANGAGEKSRMEGYADEDPWRGAVHDGPPAPGR
ncbi:MAG: hypothetical protein FWG35_08070, partial [Spirochaetaceae bacterium]|nr:hypothetical protein [Spirochaetaceae bacterium]